jgi:hypothetical protein
VRILDDGPEHLIHLLPFLFGFFKSRDITEDSHEHWVVADLEEIEADFGIEFRAIDFVVFLFENLWFTGKSQVDLFKGFFLGCPAIGLKIGRKLVWGFAYELLPRDPEHLFGFLVALNKTELIQEHYGIVIHQNLLK